MSVTKGRQKEASTVPPVTVNGKPMTSDFFRYLVFELLRTSMAHRDAFHAKHEANAHWLRSRDPDRYLAARDAMSAAIDAQEDACDALCAALGFPPWRDVVSGRVRDPKMHERLTP